MTAPPRYEPTATEKNTSSQRIDEERNNPLNTTMKFIVERTIDINVDEAWKNLANNFMAPENYSAQLIAGSEVLSQQRSGVGTKYRLLMRNGGSVENEVVEWLDGRSILTKVVAVRNFPLESMTTKVGVLPILGEEKSILYVHLDVVSKTGKLGKLDVNLLARPLYHNTVRQTMRAFEAKHCTALTKVPRSPPRHLNLQDSCRTLALTV